MEVPYQFYEINDPVNADIAGLGDVNMNLMLRPWISVDKSFTLLTGIKFWESSADNVTLRFIPDAHEIAGVNVGTGKQRLAPQIGFVYAPSKEFFIAPVYLHESSVMGDSTRNFNFSFSESAAR